MAITMGDPAGIGPELCLHACSNSDISKICQPVIYGDRRVLRDVAKKCGLPMPASELIVECDNAECEHSSLKNLQPGVVSAETGQASYNYVKRAIEAALAGEVAGVVTGPIHKEAWHAAGVHYPGHTEMFADQTKCDRFCMMLTSEEISCSLVTTHVGYLDAVELITTERIVEVIELTGTALRQIRGREPNLAVCGLNPHAGEGGLFGRGEEERLISPAIEQAREAGWRVIGPLPADTAFTPARRAEIDGYVCMVHDQGLIPLKTIAFDTGVNVTLGLPIVRTSVDHGVALDIAWQGKASATSMVAAIELAAKLAG